MLYEQTSRKSFEEIDRALREAAPRHKLGVITVHDLQQTMRKEEAITAMIRKAA